MPKSNLSTFTNPTTPWGAAHLLNPDGATARTASLGFSPLATQIPPATTGTAIVQLLGLAWFNAEDYASINALVAAAGAGPYVLRVNAVRPVTANLVLGSGIHLVFAPNCTITVNNGVTLTIHTPAHVHCGKSQRAFTLVGTGLVAFSAGRGTLYPEWWGAVADGATNSTAAIQAALDAAYATPWQPPVSLGAGQYMFSNLIVYRGCHLGGAGVQYTELKRIAGSVGDGIVDGPLATGGVGIWLHDFRLNGNNIAGADGIVMGYGTNQLGSCSKLYNLLVENCIDFCMRLNANVLFADTLEFWTSGGGLYLDGTGSLLSNLAFSMDCAVGLDIAGAFNRMSKLHFEGRYTTACLRIADDCNGNVVHDAFMYLTGGNVNGAMIQIGANGYGTHLFGISASIVVGSGSSVTNGVVYDQTFIGRKFWGQAYGADYHFIDWYRSGSGAYCGTVSVPPAVGTFVTGDWVMSVDAANGKPQGWSCTATGTPGTWEPLGFIGGKINRILSLGNGNTSGAYLYGYEDTDNGNNAIGLKWPDAITASGEQNIPDTAGTIAVSALASHDYGGAAVAWNMSAVEAAGTYFVVTNANGAADAVFPAAVPGKHFDVYNNSGQNITFKVAGQAGTACTNAKRSSWVFDATDCRLIIQQP